MKTNKGECKQTVCMYLCTGTRLKLQIKDADGSLILLLIVNRWELLHSLLS